MKKYNKIAVIYGGVSNERDVSLNTGKNCYDALYGLGYEIALIDATDNIPLFIEEIKTFAPDVVFNALHGGYGENGCVQGLLNMLKIPYTHSGVMASSIAMDKEKSKIIFKEAGVPVADSFYGSIEDLAKKNIQGKWVLKPVNEGSSVGIYLLEDKFNVNIDEWTFGRGMLEEYVPGREITVGIMDDEVLGMLEITTDREFYNYDAKYSNGGSDHIKVEGLGSETMELLKEYALLAHKSIGARGVSRCDFRIDEEENKIIILEINTQPGMTSTSLIPDIAKDKGMSYPELVKYMVENAKCDEL